MTLPPTTDQHSRRIVELVARGEAVSRSRLSAALGIAASTVGLKVQALLDAGLLREEGITASRGGRPARVLRVGSDGDSILTVDLGGRHARIGRHAVSGSILETLSIPVVLADGPVSTLDAVSLALEQISLDGSIRAIGVSLPGPVNTMTGVVELPSRMPGWQGFRVGEALAERFGVPVAVENDANLAALGEHISRFGSSHHSITVKAGTAIGSGIIVDGRLHQGASFAAGDISHTRIDQATHLHCSCGNTGCLETVASGAGLVRQMQERGINVSTTAEVLALAHDADPLASGMVRTAGKLLGEVLSGVVNFFNPHAVFLTGSMSASEPFLAAVRSRVYEGCHPLVTRDLLIEAAQTGADAILLGAAHLVFDDLTFMA
ncbi:ROK family protein [Tessaracoccus sp.]